LTVYTRLNHRYSDSNKKDKNFIFVTYGNKAVNAENNANFFKNPYKIWTLGVFSDIIISIKYKKSQYKNCLALLYVPLVIEGRFFIS